MTSFGILTAISWTAHPRNVMIYFAMSFVAVPYALRIINTLNDKKASLTMGRCLRMCGKYGLVLLGFAATAYMGGPTIIAIPFGNVFVLSFWDAFSDYLVSDGAE